VFGVSGAMGASHSTMLGRGEVEIFATGASPCVLGVHGFGGTAAELQPLLDRVSGAGFGVDAALLPGHGTTPADLQRFGFDHWVNATRARMRKVAESYETFVLLGFSLGTLVTMQLASEADRPKGLRGRIVLGNALTLEPVTRAGLAGLSRLGTHMPDLYVQKPAAGDVVDKSVLGGLVAYDRHPLRAAIETYLAGPRVRAVVGQITCPTLILHGRRDRVCPWQNAAWLADHIGSKDVSVRIFERSAHVIASDFEREEVAREVCAFLDRCGRAQSLPVEP
jgi:carboxylesterase